MLTLVAFGHGLGQDSIGKLNPSGPWSWLGSRFDPQTLCILIANKCINHVLLKRH